MAAYFEISEYLMKSETARKIVEYVSLRKAATKYQIAEAIREKPADFERHLLALEKLEVVRVDRDPTAQSYMQEPMYMLTGFGYEVAKSMPRPQAQR